MSNFTALRDFNLETINKYRLTNFVETGTNGGAAVREALALGFPVDNIYTCDIDPRCSGGIPGIHAFPGTTSTDFLTKLFAEQPDFDNALFWLDAHFPRGASDLSTADQGERYHFPLYYELEVIVNQGKRNFVILCDDMAIVHCRGVYRVETTMQSLLDITDKHYKMECILSNAIAVFVPNRI